VCKVLRARLDHKDLMALLDHQDRPA
jgi:hypothetical protein